MEIGKGYGREIEKSHERDLRERVIGDDIERHEEGRQERDTEEKDTGEKHERFFPLCLAVYSPSLYLLHHYIAIPL